MTLGYDLSLASLPEPPPTAGQVRVYDLVVNDVTNAQLREDLAERMAMGMAKYGTPLMTFNGRDPLIDAYQEVIDLVMYLRQALAEGGTVGFEYGKAVEIALSLCRALHPDGDG